MKEALWGSEIRVRFRDRLRLGSGKEYHYWESG